MNFESFKKQQLPPFEEFLSQTVEDYSKTQIEDSMNYSLNANGKRLRPLLLLATLYSFNKDVKIGYEAASALEMIHTYSLIHDDLPAMDDDDLRRGVPTNHIQYTESTAILAGDALLSLAFETITKTYIASDKKVSLIRLLAEASGYKGMVGGQQADINGEKKDLTINELESIHSRKTGELIRFALVGGGVLAEQNAKTLSELEGISYTLGIAYQIRDDILDVIGDAEDLGKAVGTDEKLGKSTYPALLGLEQAKKRLIKELDSVKESVKNIAMTSKNTNTEILVDFVNQLYLKE